MARQLTEAARAAAAIRKDLKEAYPGIRFSVTSSNYAGGNSIWIDVPGTFTHEQISAVKDIAAAYKMGEFDGMDDSYRYSNRNEDLPQVDYIFVSHTTRAKVLA